MAEKLKWNQPNLKVFETGVSKGVLFPLVAGGYPLGHAWEGLMSVTESPGGAEPTELWANNTKYATLMSKETFSGTIEAYTFPTAWEACDGGDSTDKPGVTVKQQPRQGFGLAYRTEVYSDGGGHIGYQIHLVYGALASVSEVSRNTENDSPDPGSFSYEFSTTPVGVTGLEPTSHLVIDSNTVDPALLVWLEEQIYGVDSPDTDATLPLPDDILTWVAA